MGFLETFGSVLQGVSSESAAIRAERQQDEDRQQQRVQEYLVQFLSDPKASEEGKQEVYQLLLDNALGGMGYQRKGAKKGKLGKIVEEFVGAVPETPDLSSLQNLGRIPPGAERTGSEVGGLTPGGGIPGVTQDPLLGGDSVLSVGPQGGPPGVPPDIQTDIPLGGEVPQDGLPGVPLGMQAAPPGEIPGEPPGLPPGTTGPEVPQVAPGGLDRFNIPDPDQVENDLIAQLEANLAAADDGGMFDSDAEIEARRQLDEATQAIQDQKIALMMRGRVYQSVINIPGVSEAFEELLQTDAQAAIEWAGQILTGDSTTISRAPQPRAERAPLDIPHTMTVAEAQTFLRSRNEFTLAEGIIGAPGDHVYFVEQLTPEGVSTFTPPAPTVEPFTPRDETPSSQARFDEITGIGIANDISFAEATKVYQVRGAQTANAARELVDLNLRVETFLATQPDRRAKAQYLLDAAEEARANYQALESTIFPISDRLGVPRQMIGWWARKGTTEEEQLDILIEAPLNGGPGAAPPPLPPPPPPNPLGQQ